MRHGAHAFRSGRGELLVDRQQSLRSVFAAPLRLERREQLVRERDSRQRHAARARRREHDREILLLVLDRECGLEVAGDHLLTEHVEHPGARRAAHERLVQRPAEAGPTLARERHGLGDGDQRSGDDDLVRGLAELARARRSQVRDPLSHRREDQAGFLESQRIAADEEGQRAFGRALLASRDRGVQEREAGLRRAARAIERAASAAIVEQSTTTVPGAGAADGPVLAEMDLFDLGRVGQARDDDVAIARATSSGDPAACTPPPSSRANFSALPWVRVATVSGKPAFARLRAMPTPMVPRPTNPTVSVMTILLGRSRF